MKIEVTDLDGKEHIHNIMNKNDIMGENKNGKMVEMQLVEADKVEDIIQFEKDIKKSTKLLNLLKNDLVDSTFTDINELLTDVINILEDIYYEI